jgi:hypothetical protein
MASLTFVDIDLPGEAKGGLHEGYLHVIAQIGPRPGGTPRPGAPVAEAEDIAEDVAETAEDIAAGKALKAGTAQSFVSVLIVYFSFLRVAEHLIGLGGFLELLFRLPVSRVSVRMVLHRQAAVAFLEILFGGGAGYLQNFIITSFSHGIVSVSFLVFILAAPNVLPAVNPR